ncbi:metallophosphoesterase [Alkalispirochaeta sphaeroplastigenens]|uniref:Metallophosphoesterase n=1 Tax=Alkalispirochaeta sphaeroplastigenens TaxID=1187066 RepID=A0A2S4JQK5_9SPIO|nr:metallophosphoesterase [Alkalispirochaeta sphaeroplastigenens]POR01795.1 metallophosphoesterase [Alkalispirochaeta sphaeroplastigenens]
MKILCVADHIDPLVYSATVKTRFSDVDMVLSAGDLPMEYLGFLSSSLNRTVGFVFGNHNLKALPLFRKSGASLLEQTSITAQTQNYYGSTCLEDRVMRLEGLLIAGLGGSIRYNRGEHQFTDFEMNCRLLRLVPRLLWNRLVHGRFLDILLTHAPPRGIHDEEDRCHQGFTGLLWFMRRFRPRYLLHGHIHLYDINAERVSRYHETTIINVYDHYVLDYGGDQDREQDREQPARAKGNHRIR